MKVIVVEDNPVYNDYICNLLKKGGFDTAQAYRLSTAKKLLMKAGEEYVGGLVLFRSYRTIAVFLYDTE
jgi:two-component system, NtrC family, response regulator HydG